MKKIRKGIKYFLLNLLVRFLLFLCAILPRSWVLGFFARLGRLAFRWFPKEVEKIKNHLEYAFEGRYDEQEKAKIAKEVFVKIAKNAADIFMSEKYKSATDLEKIIELDGWENFQSAFDKKNGVLVLTSHLGAFEFVGQYFAYHGYPCNIVAKKLHNPRLNDILEDFREKHGAKMIYSGESAINILKALQNGEIVFMLIDQDIRKSKGVFVDFFGKQAWTPIGATVIALRTGVPVLPIGIHRNAAEKHILTILPEIQLEKTGNKENDIQLNTQLLSNSLEELINNDIAQWVWMHERWKTKPSDIVADQQ